MLTLLLCLPANAAEDDFEFSLDGYYRVRAHHFNGVYTPDDPDDDVPALWAREPGTGRYIQHRLRLAPSVNFGDGRAEFHMMADAFDDAVWGDNEQLASTPLFAGSPSSTGLDGQPVPNFEVKRAWAKFQTPVGPITVGRQPSNWGMGLLANDGDGFDDTFGENHYGNTFDRFVFATKPLAISNAIAGKGNAELPLFLAVGFDRLVEDPLTQYYGYKCDPESPDDDVHCAESDDNGYTEERQTDHRPNNWWTEHDDDVWEMLYVLIYKGEDVEIGGTPSDLTAGAYVVNRRQGETASNVWIADAYARLVRRNLYIEAEGLTIQGHSNAIVIPGASIDAELSHPLYKEPDIWGAVGRAGYTSAPQDAWMEVGFASGDDNIGDEDFTGRPINPDFNAGLLLYEEVLARVSQEVWQDTDGLWTRGGVYNSYYLYPQVRRTLLPGWDLHGAFLVAFPHRPDGSIIVDDEGGATSPILGWEADGALKIDFQSHMRFSLEGAYGKMSDRIPWEARGLTIDGRVWTVQSRIAYEF